MSELKEVMFVEQVSGERVPSGYYKKSEADKVIAELKEKRKKNLDARRYWRKEYLIEYKEARHNKYKRCVKNREICVMRFDIELARQYPTRCAFWSKWERKWLELAEKFKEAK